MRITRETVRSALFLACTTAAAGLAGARAQEAQPQQVQLGEIVIRTGGDIDYSLDRREYVFGGNVVLTAKDRRMTAKTMTVRVTPANEMERALCEGDVFIERKEPDGTVMTAKAAKLDYREKEQKASLEGAVRVEQASARLREPAVITGERVDMDLASKVNVVLKGASGRARAHVVPKGQEGKPQPEPVDLIADRIEMHSGTQSYDATGSPEMIRPSSRLTADRLQFTVDPRTNDVTRALANGSVDYRGKTSKGSAVHCVGQTGTYDREISELTIEGAVTAEVLDPGQERPGIYKGHRFVINTATGARRLSSGPTGQAEIRLPDAPGAQKPPVAGAAASPGGAGGR